LSASSTFTSSLGLPLTWLFPSSRSHTVFQTNLDTDFRLGSSSPQRLPKSRVIVGPRVMFHRNPRASRISSDIDSGLIFLLESVKSPPDACNLKGSGPRRNRM